MLIDFIDRYFIVLLNKQFNLYAVRFIDGTFFACLSHDIPKIILRLG